MFDVLPEDDTRSARCLIDTSNHFTGRKAPVSLNEDFYIIFIKEFESIF